MGFAAVNGDLTGFDSDCMLFLDVEGLASSATTLLVTVEATVGLFFFVGGSREGSSTSTSSDSTARRFVEPAERGFGVLPEALTSFGVLEELEPEAFDLVVV